MSFIKKIFNRHWELFAVLTVLSIYFLLALSKFDFFKHQINPDAISYIGIAEKYSLGQIKDALNAYWGPLISWSMVPFVLLKLPGLYAIKFAMLAWGAIALLGIWFLSKTLGLSKFWALTVALLSIYWLVYFVFFVGTPDIIMVALVMWYGVIILSKNYSSKPALGIVAGAIGGLMYLSKSYGSIFFLSHFFISNFIIFIRNREHNREIIIKRFALGLLSFFLISIIWASLISWKYGYFTIGTSSRYNLALIGPEVKQVHPIFTQGFALPPNDLAISVWEDPSFYTMPEWSPLDSKSSLRWYLDIIKSNMSALYSIYYSYSLLFILAFFVLLVVCISPPSKREQNRFIHILLLIFVYTIGYLMSIMEARYVWPIIFILLITSVKISLDFLSRAGLLRSTYLFLLIVALIYMNVWPKIELEKNKDSGLGTYNLYSNLEASGLKMKGKIATNSYWSDILGVSYYQGNQFFGIPAQGATSEEIEKGLRDYSIDYYWYFGDLASAPEFIREKPIVKTISGANILKMK